MNTENQWANSSNNYDDEIRVEAYAENADITRDILVDEVVNQMQKEIGDQLRLAPSKTVHDIKVIAMHRFLDLIEKKLLSQNEAERCYQRFAYMVDYFHGS